MSVGVGFNNYLKIGEASWSLKWAEQSYALLCFQNKELSENIFYFTFNSISVYKFTKE